MTINSFQRKKHNSGNGIGSMHRAILHSFIEITDGLLYIDPAAWVYRMRGIKKTGVGVNVPLCGFDKDYYIYCFENYAYRTSKIHFRKSNTVVLGER